MSTLLEHIHRAEQEQWRPIPGYEGRYEASDQGRVRSVDRWVANRYGRFIRPGRLLKLTPGKRGYPLVDLRLRGALRADGTRTARGKMRTVHSVVLETFVGPRPPGMQVLHRNGDKTDNRLSNLRYGTPAENGHDRKRLGETWGAKATHCKRGHEFTAENTYMATRRSGPKAGARFRQCRACMAVAKARGEDRWVA